MSGAQLKYVRTEAGFSTCPSLSGQKQHALLAASMPGTLISAGFIEWGADGLPVCRGRSESLNLNSMACDTAALREAWGLPAAAAGEFAPAFVTSRWSPLNPAALADAKRFGERMSVLPPSLQAQAQAVDEHEVDQYGNPTSGDSLPFCCFPDCGCDGARLCQAKSGASAAAMGMNFERGSFS